NFDVDKINLVRRQRPFADIPLELFYQICENAPPSDLLALMQTCSRFHYILNNKYGITQTIWKKSRLTYFVELKRPPPPGWNELQYIRFFLTFPPVCSLCGKIDSISVRIYWELRIRSCMNCLMKKTSAMKIGDNYCRIWKNENEVSINQYMKECYEHNKETNLYVAKIKKYVEKANEVVKKLIIKDKLSTKYNPHYIYTHFTSYKRAICFFAEIDKPPTNQHWKIFKSCIVPVT
ncbi:6223_t:CDS:2, partial [Entrophospora sp. SA101]